MAARARGAAARHNIDAIISVGGGSTTGLAKAIALTTGLPVIAVPTTYAGSEATAPWGLTEGNRKTTGLPTLTDPSGIDGREDTLDAAYLPGTTGCLSFAIGPAISHDKLGA